MIDKDGTMAHVDAAGKREKMKDGKIMGTKDGSKVRMKADGMPWQHFDR